MPRKVPEVDQLQIDRKLEGKLTVGQVCAINLLVGFDTSFWVLPPRILFLDMHCCASQCGGLATACNKGPHNRSITPFPPVGWEENRTKKAKFVGWDKGSLIEQQTKGTATATIYKRGIHKTNQQNRTALSDWTPAVPSRAASELPLHRSPHQNPAWQHMVWNTWLCLARMGLGQPTRLCPFLDSGEN